MNDDTKKIFKRFGFTKKKLNKENMEDLDKAVQAINNVKKLKSETTGIAEVYANSIENLLNKNETKSAVITETKETNNDIQQQENAALTKIQNLINETSDEKLNAKERKTKFDKIKNKIKKAFFGSTKTKEQKDISEFFQRFSNDDNALIFKAINETLKNIKTGENLVDFFKNPIIRYILYHSKVFPTFEKSFMDNIGTITNNLMNTKLNNDIIRFGRTLGQKVRSALYNEQDKDKKIPSWGLILSLARSDGSSNMAQIKKNTKTALKNIKEKLISANQNEVATDKNNVYDICDQFCKRGVQYVKLYLVLGLFKEVSLPKTVTQIINEARKIMGLNNNVNNLSTFDTAKSDKTIKDFMEDIVTTISTAFDKGKQNLENKNDDKEKKKI